MKKVTYWGKSEVNVKIFGTENAMEKMNFTMDRTEDFVKITGKRVLESCVSYRVNLSNT
ncbi:MAG: hypothetical protein MZV64_44435 [Ignavibacteriales bacterium]|nr:hypothetical protein [Ignavibacteriales bacterium]